jgi:hypothetical protein
MSIANIINPEVLGALVHLRLPNLLPNVPGLDTTSEFAVGTPGTSWEIPTTGALQDLVRDGEGVTLTPQGLSQGRYKMVVQRAGQAYKVPDIDEMVAKYSPRRNLTDEITDKITNEYADNIAGKVAEYMLARRFDVIEGAIPTANRQDATDGTLEASDVRAARYKLGDKHVKLKFMLCTSKVQKDLEVAGAISFQPMSQVLPLYGTQVNQLGAAQGQNLVPTVAGMILIVTDAIAASGSSPTLYPTYLLSEKAMGLFYQRMLTIEYDRESLIDGGYDIVIPRLDFVMCLHGVSYSEGSDPQSYTSAALKNTSNYTLKFDQKDIGAVRIESQ